MRKMINKIVTSCLACTMVILGATNIVQANEKEFLTKDAYSIECNNGTLSIGCTVEEFLQTTGCFLDEDEPTTVNANDDERIYYKVINNKDFSVSLGSFVAANLTDSQKALKDCVITKINTDIKLGLDSINSHYDGSVYNQMTYINGLQCNQIITREELFNLLGHPTKISEYKIYADCQTNPYVIENAPEYTSFSGEYFWAEDGNSAYGNGLTVSLNEVQLADENHNLTKVLVIDEIEIKKE